MAIGIKLLTGMPLMYGTMITVFDTFLFLFLQRFGIRKMEAFILVLVATIGFSFLIQMFIAKPDLSYAIQGVYSIRTITRSFVYSSRYYWGYGHAS